MSHPQNDFTSQFQSDGNDGNASLTVVINGVPHVYTPQGNDKEWTVEGAIVVDMTVTYSELAQYLARGLPVYLHVTGTGIDYIVPYVGGDNDTGYRFAIPDTQNAALKYWVLLSSNTWSIGSVPLTPATGVTPGTYTKVTVNDKGAVTVGGTLAAADIPNLPASILTSGTLDPDRIADGSVDIDKLVVDISKGLVDGLNTTVHVEDNEVMVDAHDNTIANLTGASLTPVGATDTLTIELGKYYYIESDHNVRIDLESDESETTVHTNLNLGAADNCVSYDIAFQSAATFQTAHLYVNVSPGTVVPLYCQIRKIETAPNVFRYPARVWQSYETY